MKCPKCGFDNLKIVTYEVNSFIGYYCDGDVVDANHTQTMFIGRDPEAIALCQDRRCNWQGQAHETGDHTEMLHLRVIRDWLEKNPIARRAELIGLLLVDLAPLLNDAPVLEANDKIAQRPVVASPGVLTNQ